jgi:hypothetical protein
MEGNHEYLEKLLSDVDLSEYSGFFISNDLIDEDVISKLGNNDLEKIGITSLGHRIKLLNAIKKHSEVIDDAKYTEDSPGTKYVPINNSERNDTKNGPWKTVGWLLVVLIVIAIIALSGI